MEPQRQSDSSGFAVCAACSQAEFALVNERYAVVEVAKHWSVDPWSRRPLALVEPGGAGRLETRDCVALRHGDAYVVKAADEAVLG